MLTRRHVLTGAGAVVAAGAAGCSAAPDSAYENAVQSVWSPQSSPANADDLRYLVHYAVLAANSHNTQAWRFAGNGSRVTITPDRSRATPVVDPDEHHLFASLGCAAENLMLASAAAGRAAASAYAGDDRGRVEIDLAGTATGRDPLFDAILDRQCTRSDYDGRSVSAQDLETLRQAAAVDGCTLVPITEKTKIEQALELIVSANTAQVENPDFVRELKAWLRFNATQALATRDGLYSACSGNPSLPPWLGRLIFPYVFTAKGENDRYAKQVRSSAGLAVIVSEKNDPAHWVAAGRSYQRFALQATALGIRHALVNQPVEVASFRPQFARWLGIGERRPDLVIRYGYAPPMPRSLRRPVDAVIV